VARPGSRSRADCSRSSRAYGITSRTHAGRGGDIIPRTRMDLSDVDVVGRPVTRIASSSYLGGEGRVEGWRGGGVEGGGG